MKVVVISPFGKTDGIAVYTANLLTQLKRIADVQAYHWNYSGIKKFFSPFIELGKLKRVLKTADVVHVQYALSAYLFLFLPVLCFLRKKAKLILTLHEEYDNVPFSALVKLWHYAFYSCADRLIVHTEVSRRNLPKFLRKKTVVLPMGIVYRERTSRKPVKGQILLPGFINRWKGHDVAIRAFSIVAKKFSEAKLIIVGKAHDKRFFREILSLIKNLGLERKVEVREGYSPDKELFELLRTSEIAILPYRRITMSAMLCDIISWNVPTVMSDLKQFIEFTRNKGSYFRIGNADELAKKMISLLKSRSEQKRLELLFRSLASEHSWENIALRTKESYIL